MEGNKLKILWSSVTPTVESGYGRVTREIVSRLLKHGFDVMNHGYQTRGKLHTVDNTFKMLDCGGLAYGSNVIPEYARRYKREALITLFDPWIFPDNMPYLGLPWIPYFPVDAEPVSWIQYNLLKKAFKTISLSEFAREELEKVGIKSTIIPHGVDTKVFKPLKNRNELRKKFGIPENAFLIGTNGANQWDRKDFPRMIRIFAEFIKRTKADAYLYIHANPNGQSGKAFNLSQLGELYGVRKRLRFPIGDINNFPFHDTGLAKMYNTFDVYLSTSRAEGCGLPILEAQACGVPAIVPDNSAQPEWVRGHGWVVLCSDHIVVLTTPQHNKWYLTDVNKCVEALEEAYRNPVLRQKYGEMSRKAMKEYDWDKIVKEKWIPFLKEAEKELNNPYPKEYFDKRDKADKSLNYQQIMEALRGSSVLEMGCGTGDLLDKMKKMGCPEVYGFDVSKYAVQEAKKKGVQAIVHNADEKLPYEDNSIDTVFSIHLLEHCKNDMRVIIESLRVCKKRVLHLIPLGYRNDWTHKRVYGFSDVMSRLNPSKTIAYQNGDLLLIYDKVSNSRKET